MFARLDFPRFLVCCSGDLCDNESEENPSVAICGGSICILTGLKCKKINLDIVLFEGPGSRLGGMMDTDESRLNGVVPAEMHATRARIVCIMHWRYLKYSYYITQFIRIISRKEISLKYKLL